MRQTVLVEIEDAAGEPLVEAAVGLDELLPVGLQLGGQDQPGHRADVRHGVPRLLDRREPPPVRDHVVVQESDQVTAGGAQAGVAGQRRPCDRLGQVVHAGLVGEVAVEGFRRAVSAGRLSTTMTSSGATSPAEQRPHEVDDVARAAHRGDHDAGGAGRCRGGTVARPRRTVLLRDARRLTRRREAVVDEVLPIAAARCSTTASASEPPASTRTVPIGRLCSRTSTSAGRRRSSGGSGRASSTSSTATGTCPVSSTGAAPPRAASVESARAGRCARRRSGAAPAAGRSAGRAG